MKQTKTHNPILKTIARFYLWLTGWKYEGEPLPVDKCIVVGGYHTSNWDFMVIMSVRYSIPHRDINFLAKHTLFWWPLGPLLRFMGGIPVVRHKKSNMVDSVVDLFHQRDELILGISPEGTRKKGRRWKTGFYHIAQGAGVPIQVLAIDYASKTVRFRQPFYVSGDMDADFKKIQEFLDASTPKHPQFAGRHFSSSDIVEQNSAYQ